MSSLQAERKIFLDERQSIIAERETMRSQQDTIKNNEKNIRNELKFKDLESCDKQIKELEKRQSTTSLSLNDEKKLLKDIKSLTESKKAFLQLEELRANFDKAKSTKESIDQRYAANAAKVDEVSARINEHKKVMDKLFGATSEQRDQIPVLLAKIEAIKLLIGDKRKEIHQLEDDFKKLEDEYFTALKEERRKQEEAKAAEIERKRLEKEQREKEA